MSFDSSQFFFEGLHELPAPYRLGEATRPLQLAFAKLFDDAAHAVFLAGSDLDEVLVERFFIARTAATDCTIPADFLSDADLLKKSVLNSIAANAGGATHECPEIRAVKIIARHDVLRPK